MTQNFYPRDPDPAHCTGQPERLRKYLSTNAGMPTFVSTATEVLRWNGACQASFYGACVLCGAHPQSTADHFLLDGKAVGVWMGHIDDPTRQIAFICNDCTTGDDQADTNCVLSALGIDPGAALDWWTSKPHGQGTNYQNANN